MKMLRRALLVLLLTAGAGACTTGSILGPEDVEQAFPDSGSALPDSGSALPDSGS